jgi:hypothetical protein
VAENTASAPHHQRRSAHYYKKHTAHPKRPIKSLRHVMEGEVDYTWTTGETQDLTHVRLIGAGAIGTAVHEVRLLYLLLPSSLAIMHVLTC